MHERIISEGNASENRGHVCGFIKKRNKDHTKQSWGRGRAGGWKQRADWRQQDKILNSTTQLSIKEKWLLLRVLESLQTLTMCAQPCTVHFSYSLCRSKCLFLPSKKTHKEAMKDWGRISCLSPQALISLLSLNPACTPTTALYHSRPEPSGDCKDWTKLTPQLRGEPQVDTMGTELHTQDLTC